MATGSDAALDKSDLCKRISKLCSSFTRLQPWKTGRRFQPNPDATPIPTKMASRQKRASIDFSAGHLASRTKLLWKIIELKRNNLSVKTQTCSVFPALLRRISTRICKECSILARDGRVRFAFGQFSTVHQREHWIIWRTWRKVHCRILMAVLNCSTTNTYFLNYYWIETLTTTVHWEIVFQSFLGIRQEIYALLAT